MEYDFAAPPVAPPVDPDNYYHPLMDYDNILFTFYAKAKMVFKLLATK
jgi:hypothetical protein